MSPAESAAALKEWRCGHGFSQRQAVAAIGTSANVLGDRESQDGTPYQPARLAKSSADRVCRSMKS